MEEVSDCAKTVRAEQRDAPELRVGADLNGRSLARLADRWRSAAREKQILEGLALGECTPVRRQAVKERMPKEL